MLHLCCTKYISYTVVTQLPLRFCFTFKKVRLVNLAWEYEDIKFCRLVWQTSLLQAGEWEEEPPEMLTPTRKSPLKSKPRASPLTPSLHSTMPAQQKSRLLQVVWFYECWLSNIQKCTLTCDFFFTVSIASREETTKPQTKAPPTKGNSRHPLCALLFEHPAGGAFELGWLIDCMGYNFPSHQY